MAEFAKSVTWNFIGNAASPVVGLISAPLLARGLGVDGRGLLAGGVAPFTLFVSIATLGLTDALTYYAASNQRLERRVILACVVLLFFFGAVAGAALLATTTVWGDSKILPHLFIFAACALPPSLALAGVRAVAMGEHRWMAVSIERLISAFGRLLLLILLLGLGRLSVVSAMVVSVVVPLLGWSAYVPWRRRFSEQRFLFSDQPRVGTYDLSKYATSVWLGSLAGVLLMRLDQLLILPLSSASQLGLYAVAVTVAELLLVIGSSIRDVVFSIESAGAEIEKLACVSRVSTTLMVVLAAVLWLVSLVAVPIIFGRGFSSATSMIAVLAAAIALGNAGSLAGAGLGARGRPLFRTVSLIAAVFVNAVSIYLFVPKFGGLGAAWATLLGNTIAGGMNVIWIARLDNYPIARFMLPSVADFRIANRVLRSSVLALPLSYRAARRSLRRVS